MKQFMAIYVGSPAALASWDKLTDSERKQRQAAGMRAWREWMTTHREDVIDDGGPLGKTKRANTEGVADIRNSMAAYVIVQAESHDAAAKMFLNHPHFTVFPGDSIEIMECLPVPAAAA